MKEATGELNMTVIIAIAVAILAAFFYTILWPMIRTNFDSKASCSRAICECDAKCKETGFGKCHLKGKNNEIRCPWKG